MKKTVCALLALLMITTLVGCGTKEPAASPSVSEAFATQIHNQSKTESAVDVDLTALSSTMVYSEVYNMMTAPETYVGKTVKMNGQFSMFQTTDANGQPIPSQIYFACVIADATACCQQGLEFVLAGDATYPDDYPEQGTEITVVGEFQTYMEGTNQFCHLINATLVG